MDFRELLDVLWRRKLVVAVVTMVAVLTAIGALRLVTPLYESTSTIVLSPRDTEEDIFILTTIDSIVPVYASAATTRTTQELARARVGGELGDISVRTFRDTPIIKIRARHSDPDVASRSAQAITEILLAEVRDKRIGIPSVQLTQIDRPARAEEPVFPRYGLTIAVATFLGFCFGIAAALLRENLTSKVETPEALTALTGVPCFAEVPNEPAVTQLRSPDDLLTDTRLRALSESLRDLRTNLLFSAGSTRSIVVTSPEGSHGKTTVSLGLAVTLARSGTRTILVDCDLRKGRVAEMLVMPRSPGVMEALRGMPIEDVVQRTPLETLDILTGGTLETDPGELLMAQFPALLRELESMYESVVVDTTPLVPVNDARFVASSGETVLIVASADSATRRHVRAAVERLSLISLRPTATVLNNSRAPRAKGYYGYLHPDRPERRVRRGKRQVARPRR
jgi:capsular exopolysaccharide synthesis family protein